MRAGTSGVNVEEATAAQSRKYFIAKMAIASKEGKETRYWLRLTEDSRICEKIDLSETLVRSEEIIKILTSIVKTSQNNQ